MANDPNRDLLPVKENCLKLGKGLSERIDHQILVKLPRCELEDRFLRLLDEQIHLKKLINCQEEKIKRLGTKLMRVINEKKSGKKNLDFCKETEELHFRIIELEHENYTLKDKNIVLKQQLANHSRHITHPSSLLSTHTSPLMSVRQTTTNQNEIAYESEIKNTSTETQLRDAELHIKKLNEEIKSLHCKIDYLQQDVEKSSLDNRKTKVTENIELIRLQRSLKQQSIQIATLQAQVKNSEINQTMLKEELEKAHKDNDDAVNVISLKQNEILSLCAKLEENSLNRLEEDELRERIRDLAKERDALKERSEFLMKTIEIKSEEAEKADTFKRLLAEEKLKKAKLEGILRETKGLLKRLQDARKDSVDMCKCCCQALNRSTETSKAEFKEGLECENEPAEQKTRRESNDCVQDTPDTGVKIDIKVSSDVNAKPNSNQKLIELDEGNGIDDRVCESKIERENFSAEKLKLKREMEYLRQMLRSQTARCEAQQTQINRLMYELKVNEEKCDFILQRERSVNTVENLQNQNSSSNKNQIAPVIAQESESVKLLQSEMLQSHNSLSATQQDSRNDTRLSSDIINLTKKGSEFDVKRRFVDEVFLESSEEEELSEGKVEKATLMKKLETLENSKASSREEYSPENRGKRDKRINPMAESLERKTESRRKMSIDSWMYPNEWTLKTKEKSQETKNETNELLDKNQNHKVFVQNHEEDSIQIGIVWLQIETSNPLWRNESIKLLFVDFSFLGIKGEETETPNSLRKPQTPDEKCEFNFYKTIDITGGRKEMLNSLLNRPDMDLIVFKVVTDPEKSYDDLECEDVGVAVVTVKQFLLNSNKGPTTIPVHNMNNYKEVIGKLCISISATANLFSANK